MQIAWQTGFGTLQGGLKTSSVMLPGVSTLLSLGRVYFILYERCRCCMRMKVKFEVYPDGCVAVVNGDRRGPCGHSRPCALRRWRHSGFIEDRSTGR